jgi:hypothetical protein
MVSGRLLLSPFLRPSSAWFWKRQSDSEPTVGIAQGYDSDIGSPSRIADFVLKRRADRRPDIGQRDPRDVESGAGERRFVASAGCIAVRIRPPNWNSTKLVQTMADSAYSELPFVKRRTK